VRLRTNRSDLHHAIPFQENSSSPSLPFPVRNKIENARVSPGLDAISPRLEGSSPISGMHDPIFLPAQKHMHL
jgi:hypothetical protein